MVTRPVLLATLVLAGCSRAPSQQAHPTPSTAPSPAGSIPVTLQGSYGLTAAACTAGRDATPEQVRGLLTIGGAAIAFGVSQQSVDSVAIRADRVVFGTSAAAEDGAVESRTYVFRASPDGRQLTRIETGRPDLVYTRCPNRPS